uniref:Uncharacterized protein n=1 Tax=Parascaris univalens TaxID=6257 RepID=A0A915AYM3_PARUN
MSFFSRLFDGIFRIRRQQQNRQQQTKDCNNNDKNAVCFEPTETMTQETPTEETYRAEKSVPTLKRNDVVENKFPNEQAKLQSNDTPRKEKPTTSRAPSKKLPQKPLAENEQTEFEKVNAKMRPAISRKSSRSEDRNRAKKDIERLMTGPQWRNQKKKRKKKTCVKKDAVSEEDDVTKTATTATTTTTTETTTTEGNDAIRGKEGGVADEDSTENDDYGTKTACNVPFANMQFQ